MWGLADCNTQLTAVCCVSPYEVPSLISLSLAEDSASCRLLSGMYYVEEHHMIQYWFLHSTGQPYLSAAPCAKKAPSTVMSLNQSESRLSWLSLSTASHTLHTYTNCFYFGLLKAGTGTSRLQSQQTASWLVNDTGLNLTKNGPVNL